MLGSPTLFIPGIVVVSLATALQAGATGAVKTVKMSAKLVAPDLHGPHDAALPDGPPALSEAVAPPGEEAAPAPSLSGQAARA
jgi:hypothetical protein